MFFRNVGCRKTKEEQHLFFNLIYSPKTGTEHTRTQTISVTGPVDGDHLMLVKARRRRCRHLHSSIPEDGNRSRFGNAVFFSKA